MAPTRAIESLAPARVLSRPREWPHTGRIEIGTANSCRAFSAPFILMLEQGIACDSDSLGFALGDTDGTDKQWRIRVFRLVPLARCKRSYCSLQRPCWWQLCIATAPLPDSGHVATDGQGRLVLMFRRVPIARRCRCNRPTSSYPFSLGAGSSLTAFMLLRAQNLSVSPLHRLQQRLSRICAWYVPAEPTTAPIANFFRRVPVAH